MRPSLFFAHETVRSDGNNLTCVLGPTVVDPEAAR